MARKAARAPQARQTLHSGHFEASWRRWPRKAEIDVGVCHRKRREQWRAVAEAGTFQPGNLPTKPEERLQKDYGSEVRHLTSSMSWTATAAHGRERARGLSGWQRAVACELPRAEERSRTQNVGGLGGANVSWCCTDLVSCFRGWPGRCHALHVTAIMECLRGRSLLMIPACSHAREDAGKHICRTRSLGGHARDVPL